MIDEPLDEARDLGLRAHLVDQPVDSTFGKGQLLVRDIFKMPVEFAQSGLHLARVRYLANFIFF